jgi:hypothetical protein
MSNRHFVGWLRLRSDPQLSFIQTLFMFKWEWAVSYKLFGKPKLEIYPNRNLARRAFRAVKEYSGHTDITMKRRMVQVNWETYKHA